MRCRILWTAHVHDPHVCRHDLTCHHPLPLCLSTTGTGAVAAAHPVDGRRISAALVARTHTLVTVANVGDMQNLESVVVIKWQQRKSSECTGCSPLPGIQLAHVGQ